MEALIADLDRVLHLGAPLAALAPLAEPDVYTPKSNFALNTARYFYNLLGKGPAPF